MVNLNSDRTDRLFKALSDGTRRGILARIAREDLTVAELGAPFKMSAPAISKHLRVLERADLIERIKDGKRRRFKLKTNALEEAKAVIEDLAVYWSKRLDSLDELLKETQKQERKTK